MAKLRVDKVVDGNIVWHEHQVEDIGDIATTYAKLDLSNQPFVAATDTTTAFQIQANDTTPVFNIDTLNQRVGIGTDAPTNSLHVKSSSAIPALIESTSTISRLRIANSQGAHFDMEVNGATSGYVIMGSGSTGVYPFRLNASAPNNALVIGTNDTTFGTKNFVISTNVEKSFQFNYLALSPDDKIAGLKSFYNISPGYVNNEIAFYRGSDNDKGYFTFSTSQVERMRFAEDGAITITNDTASVIPFAIKAAPSQTANLTEWQNSSGVVIGLIDERGIPEFRAGTGAGNNFIGNNAGTTASTGTSNIGIGTSALDALTTGSANICIGTNAGGLITTSNSNVAIGSNALAVGNGQSNMAVGNSALGNNTGNSNSAIGALSLYQQTSGNDNVGIGTGAGWYNVTGDNNVLIGSSSGKGVENNSYSNNTFIGKSTGLLITTGSSNVLIGYLAGSQLTTESNKLYIANSDTTTPLIYGEFDTPLLTVNGQFKTAQDRVKSTETSTTTATMSDDVEVHFCNGSSDYTLTLPTNVLGKVATIINKGTSIITLSPVSGSIGGETTQQMYPNDVYVIHGDGTNWY